MTMRWNTSASSKMCSHVGVGATCTLMCQHTPVFPTHERNKYRSNTMITFKQPGGDFSIINHLELSTHTLFIVARFEENMFSCQLRYLLFYIYLISKEILKILL